VSKGFKETPATASSTNVVAVSLRAALNGSIYSSRVSEAKFPTTKISALNGVMVLNGQVSERTVDAVRAEAESANESNNQTQLARATPTADLLRKKSTGPKVGSKMIIKVDPEPGSERGGKVTPGLIFDKFSLQAVTESDDERYQLHETFAEEVLFVFGRRPRVWTLAGIVVNSADANYADSLIANYDAYYRGTRVIEKRARTFVFYEDVLIECTLLGLTVSRNSQIPSAVNASLTMVVHERGFIQQRSEDISDPNLAQFLAAAQASLNDETVPLDDIETRKPVSAEIEKAAAETASQETLSNAEVADLEQQLSAANSALDIAVEDQVEAESEAQAARVAAASARAAGNEAEASRQEQIAAEKDREARDHQAFIQEAAEAVVSLEGQIEEKKKELEEASAKSDAQTSTAKAAAAAEGANPSSPVVQVDVDGVIVVDSSIVEGATVFGSRVTVSSGGQLAVTVNGGDSIQVIHETYEQADSFLRSSYGVSLNKEQLLAQKSQSFSSKVSGRIL
jgi:hypothetical protein